MNKYVTIDGRANRTEYWVFYLFNSVILLLLEFIADILGTMTSTDQRILVIIYQLFILIPSITVGIRRMHDIDRSGWWLLFPVVNFFFLIAKGTDEENRFGPSP